MLQYMALSCYIKNSLLYSMTFCVFVIKVPRLLYFIVNFKKKQQHCTTLACAEECGENENILLIFSKVMCVLKGVVNTKYFVIFL